MLFGNCPNCGAIYEQDDCDGVCPHCNHNILAQKRNKDTNEPIDDSIAFKMLKEMIDEFGLEETFCRIQTMPHQVIEIVGKDTFFFSKGQGIMFIGYIPIETFDKG